MGADLDRLRHPGHFGCRVPDHIDRADLLGVRLDRRAHRRGVGTVEFDERARSSELGVRVDVGVDRHRGAGDRRGDADGDEGQHEELLAPFAPEQAPRPAHDGAARGRARSARAVHDRRPGPAASSDSGPSGARV